MLYFSFPLFSFFFFIQYKNTQNEVLKTIGLQTTKLHNKNDNPGSKNHDYPKGHLGRNPITFDQIPTVLDCWIFVDVGYVGFGKVIGILP